MDNNQENRTQSPPSNNEVSKQVVKTPVDDIDILDVEKVKTWVGVLKKLDVVTRNDNSLVLDSVWEDAYRAKGKDFKKLRQAAPQQSAETTYAINDRFIRSKEKSPFGVFLETFPLVANRPKILGNSIEAEIKGATVFDDRHNSRVDTIITLKNTIDYSTLDKSLKPDITPKKVTFLVDVTSNPSDDEDGSGVAAKNESLRADYLAVGKRANVLGYVSPDAFKVPGLDAPKIVIYMSEEEVLSFAKNLKYCMQETSNGGVMITNDRLFEEDAKKFFNEYFKAAQSNAQESIVFLTKRIQELTQEIIEDETVLSDLSKSSLHDRTKERIVEGKKMKEGLISLKDSYERVYNFLVIYQKTK